MCKRGPNDPEFQAIQKTWDAVLRRSGFVDLEGGFDLAEMDGATTFDRDLVGPKLDRSRRVVLFGTAEDDEAVPAPTLDDVQMESEELFGSPSIAATPTAQAWSRFVDGAHLLPGGRDKKLLLDVADAGCITVEILDRYRLGRQRVRTIVARHARAVRIPVAGLLTGGRTRKRA